MANVRTDFSTFLAPGLRKVLFEEFQRRKEEFSQVFMVDTSKRAFEEDSQMVGLGAMPEKGEGVPIFFDEGKEGFLKRYTHKSYGLGFRVTEEAREDDLYRMIMKLPKALGTSAKQTVEVTAADLINNGFTASTGSDGVSLFNSAHPNAGGFGGTGSNILATPADLSPTSLKEALVQFEDTFDDRNLPLLLRARKLIVPSNLRWTAQEILKSSQKPGSADNDINPLAQTDLTWGLWHYMTDPNQWLIVGDVHNVWFFWRKRLSFSNTMDFDTGDAKFKATMRFSVGHSDWRGIFASTGT